MIKYLHKESEHKVILGSFKTNPFSDNIVIFPLNSVPKMIHKKEGLFWMVTLNLNL